MAWSASPDHMASLRGITGVAVRFEPVNEDARYDGLNPQTIQVDVEQSLKKAGVKLLTAPEAYSVNTTLALLQDAVSARDSNLKLKQAKTWDAGYLTIIPRADVRRVRGIVQDLMNEFIKDWQTANGKK
ncbi:MAG: hypothetical protein H6Q86_1304 [candidate division NC10 bacterium]|nr:hypothetical protein [candidate division NC10 bacterium]